MLGSFIRLQYIVIEAKKLGSFIGLPFIVSDVQSYAVLLD